MHVQDFDSLGVDELLAVLLRQHLAPCRDDVGQIIVRARLAVPLAKARTDDPKEMGGRRWVLPTR